MLLTTVLLFFQRPTRLDWVGGYEMACGHCRRPRKNKLATQLSLPCGIPRGFSSVPPENLATQLSSPLRESRGASRPFPRKTLSHNFHHRGCIPRGFSYVLVAPTTGLLKNPSSCTATREPGREPSREPSKTQPPQGLSPFTLHCLFHDFVGLSPLPRGRVFTRIVNFTPINHRFCVI